MPGGDPGSGSDGSGRVDNEDHRPEDRKAPSDRRSRLPDMKAALRVARVEDAERAQARADLRGAEFARLEILRDALGPVLAQIPDEVDLFDIGIMPGQTPRLFVDMIGFVEMAHDKRHYRFVQDTRHGRVVLAESARLDEMSQAIAAYMARRLVERDKALAADGSRGSLVFAASSAEPADRSHSMPQKPKPARRSRWLARAFGLFLNYLGFAALCGLLWLVAQTLLAHWPHAWG